MSEGWARGLRNPIAGLIARSESPVFGSSYRCWSCALLLRLEGAERSFRRLATLRANSI
jgi:hypothetical protein